MSAQPKFHIITATHNRLNLLKRCLESILSQDYQNYQVYVVNDASADGTKEFLQSLETDVKIKYFHLQTNQGVNAARNVALQNIPVSAADWFIIVDDDDALVPECLGYLSDQIVNAASHINWLIAPCIYFDGNPIGKFKMFGRHNYINDYMIEKTMPGDCIHVIRTQILGGLRFPSDIKQTEEWIFFGCLAQTQDMWALEKALMVKEYLPDGLTMMDVNQALAEELAERKLHLLRGKLTPAQAQRIRLQPYLDKGIKGSIRTALSKGLPLPDQMFILKNAFRRLLLFIKSRLKI